MLVVGAVLLAVVAAVVPDVPVVLRAAGFGSAAAIVAGAVVLVVAGLRAYRELTYGASWRLHCTLVVVGHATLLLVALLGLAGGFTVAVLPAAVGRTTFRQFVPDGPRVDVVVAIAMQLVVGVACLAAVACGFLVPGVPDGVTAGWISAGVVLPILAWSLLRERRALRTAPER